MTMLHPLSYLLLFVTTVATVTSAIETASTTNDDEQSQEVCPHRRHRPSSTKSALPSPFIYDTNTGSAQAYKPNAPINTSVCKAMTTTTKSHYNYKVTNRWLPWRSVRKSPAPIVKVNGRLVDVDLEVDLNMDSRCRDDGLAFIPDNDDSAHVEVWQALPDGTYSSLLSTSHAPSQRQNHGYKEDGCRARVPLLQSSVSSNPLSFVFETYAPGATGAMGGLGPGGWDIPPWKLPVIHILTWLDGYQLSLIEIPITPYGSEADVATTDNGDSTGTSYKRSFNWGEASFHWNHTGDELDVTVDIHMRRKHPNGINEDYDDDNNIASRKDRYFLEADLRRTLCQRHSDYGWWYPSSPQSFFMEPITLCRPFMLDLFPL